jgi:hypothetical protein
MRETKSFIVSICRSEWFERRDSLGTGCTNHLEAI